MVNGDPSGSVVLINNLDAARIALLTRDPLPKVEDAYTTFSREESHRWILESSNGEISFNNNGNRVRNPNLSCKNYDEKLLSLTNDTPGNVHANMAVVPGYCISLLYVNKLIKDSKLCVGFDEDKYYIHDLKNEITLETGSDSGGLYLFDIESNNTKGRIPLRFWSEYVLTTVYLINRLPTSVLNVKSPYDLSVISFPPLEEEDGTEGPMIIEAEMGGHFSSPHVWGREAPLQKSCLNTALTDSARGDEEHSTFAWMNFMVVRSPCLYNGIIGRSGVRRIQAVPSIAHGMLKFLVTSGTVTLRSSRIIPLECIMVLGTGTQQLVINQVTEEKIKVAIHPEYPEQTIAIGSTLIEEGRTELCGLLRHNLDVFAWKPADMTGVSRHIAEHRLNIHFKDLNKACPKDGYPLPEIDWKVCPDKVEAVLGLPSPKCLKDVQRLNGKLASLNRFLSKSTEKSLPFFKTLKKCTKKSDFQWTAEAETVFKQMKILIAELPMLTAPKEKEELIIYLVAAKEAISPVLMTERDRKQVPIYFVSHALQGSEINYILMEKVTLALVSARRLLKWSFELEEHDIHYRPRTSVKGQILVDFIVERPEDDPSDTPMEDEKELPDPWILFTDGSSCIDGSGADLILTNLEGMEFTYALRFRFNATNNEAEYEALIAMLAVFLVK
ncbi:reverse transcriptase domain-containing protein [Tanacetum coccineum]